MRQHSESTAIDVAAPPRPGAVDESTQTIRGALSSRTSRVVLLIAYLFGAQLWVRFLRYGQPDLMMNMDWQRVAYYFAAVQEALRTHALPLYYPVGIDGEWINFYWAHPDTPLLPHLLLLRFIEPARFIVVTAIAFYTAGFLGVLAIARRYALTLVPTLLLLVLLLTNGYLIGHLSAGHAAWMACFLIPWWCYYTWALVDGEPIPGSSVKLAALLAVVLLNGGTHLALWCWLALAVVAITRPGAWSVVVRAGCWFLLFAAIRLVPTLTVFPLQATLANAWMGGYDWPLLRAAVLHGQPAITQYRPFQWEYDAYLGWPAAAFLVVFGFVAPFFLPQRGRHVRLLAAIAFFLCAMTGDWLVRLRDNPAIPILAGERMPTRMIIMPIVVLTVQACVTLQWVLDRLAGRMRRTVLAGAIGLVCATGILFQAYADLLTPSATGEFVVPPPYLPSVPSGSDWGTLPLATVPYDPDSIHQSASFNMIYVQAIEIGSMVTGAGIVLALSEVVSTRRRRRAA